MTSYIVVDDFGELGRAYRETDAARRADDHRDSLTGQYSRPVRVNTAEQWSRDVSEDIAPAVAERAKSESRELKAPT